MTATAKPKKPTRSKEKSILELAKEHDLQVSRNALSHVDKRYRGSVTHWNGMASDAAGVNPIQIPEMKEALRKAGAPCDFHPRTGQAIFTSRAHRQQVVRAMGLHDRNGGFGDP